MSTAREIIVIDSDETSENSNLPTASVQIAGQHMNFPTALLLSSDEDTHDEQSPNSPPPFTNCDVSIFDAQCPCGKQIRYCEGFMMNNNMCSQQPLLWCFECERWLHAGCTDFMEKAFADTKTGYLFRCGRCSSANASFQRVYLSWYAKLGIAPKRR